MRARDKIARKTQEKELQKTASWFLGITCQQVAKKMGREQLGRQQYLRKGLRGRLGDSLLPQ